MYPQAPERSPGVYNNVAPPGARVAAIVELWRSDKIACGRRRLRCVAAIVGLWRGDKIAVVCAIAAI